MAVLGFSMPINITEDTVADVFCLTNILIISWLGRQFWSQTFEDDVEVNIDEIRELIDMDRDYDEATEC